MSREEWIADHREMMRADFELRRQMFAWEMEAKMRIARKKRLIARQIPRRLAATWARRRHAR